MGPENTGAKRMMKVYIVGASFLATFFLVNRFAYLLLWFFVFGDSGVPFGYWAYAAGGAAGIFVAWRVWSQSKDKKSQIISLVLSSAIVFFFALDWVDVGQVQGSTPEAAVWSTIREFDPQATAKNYSLEVISRQRRDHLPFRYAGEYLLYLVKKDGKPWEEVIVGQYWKFWWSVAGNGEPGTSANDYFW